MLEREDSWAALTVTFVALAVWCAALVGILWWWSR